SEASWIAGLRVAIDLECNIAAILKTQGFPNLSVTAATNQAKQLVFGSENDPGCQVNDSHTKISLSARRGPRREKRKVATRNRASVDKPLTGVPSLQRKPEGSSRREVVKSLGVV